MLLNKLLKKHWNTHTKCTLLCHVTQTAGCAISHQYTNLHTCHKQNTTNPVQNNTTQIPLHINSSSAHQQQCAVWYLHVAAVIKFCLVFLVTFWWR